MVPVFEGETIPVNSDEKLLGLFSHLSIFLGGIALPVIFWAVYKDKSKFIAFHSLQALFFQLSYIVLILISVFLILSGTIGISLLTASGPARGSEEAPVIFIIALALFYFFIFLVVLGSIAYSVYMGINAYQGRLRKYPLFGKIIFKKVYGGA